MTLPGVGTLTLTVKADGTVDNSTANMPTATATGANFSAGTPEVSGDGTHVTVTFINLKAPTQTYILKVKVHPPTNTSSSPTVVAVAKPVGGHDDEMSGHEGDDGDGSRASSGDDQSGDDQAGDNQAGENQSGTNHADHESVSGAQHEGGQGSNGNGHGQGGD